LIGAGLIVATGIRAREDSSTKLKEWTDAQAIPSVAVALPSGRALSPTIDLPGRLEAYSRAPIFARVSGYLKSWNADIGTKVRAGDVIAEIEAPDLDQQLLQARADLVSQQSSAQLSEATLTRRKSLLASNFVSMQEIDERITTLQAAGLPIKEFPQTTGNTTLMGQSLFDLLNGQNLIVYPSDELRQQALSTVAIENPRGWRIAKEKASRKIDAIVALAMACCAGKLHRAVFG